MIKVQICLSYKKKGEPSREEIRSKQSQEKVEERRSESASKEIRGNRLERD